MAACFGVPDVDIAKITERCAAHPEGGEHECMQREMRCTYCAVRLAPYPCHGCGQFMTAVRMYGAATGEHSHRCEACEP